MSLYLLPHVGTRLVHVFRLIRLAGTFLLQQTSRCWPRRAVPHCNPSPRPSCAVLFIAFFTRTCVQPFWSTFLLILFPSCHFGLCTSSTRITSCANSSTCLFWCLRRVRRRLSLLFTQTRLRSSAVDRSFARHCVLPKNPPCWRFSLTTVNLHMGPITLNHIWTRPRFSYASARALDGNQTQAWKLRCPADGGALQNFVPSPSQSFTCSPL